MAEKTESDSGRRDLKGITKWLFIASSLIAVGAGICYNFYIQFFGLSFSGNGYLYFLIGLYLPLAFLSLPFRKSSPLNKVPWYDIVFAILSFISAMYVFYHSIDVLQLGWEFSAPFQARILSFILIIMVLEGARRSGGLPFF